MNYRLISLLPSLLIVFDKILVVNTSKTELLNVSRVYTNFPPVIIDGRVIHPSASVRNIRVIFDSTLSFDSHISSISKSANFHLCRLVIL